MLTFCQGLASVCCFVHTCLWITLWITHRTRPKPLERIASIFSTPMPMSTVGINMPLLSPFGVIKRSVLISDIKATSSRSQSTLNHAALDIGTRPIPLPWAIHLLIHGVGLEYGGFIHTRPSHGVSRPSSMIERNLSAGIHGEPSGGEQTSMSYLRPSASKIKGGV